jgi:hypothetical protein
MSGEGSMATRDTPRGASVWAPLFNPFERGFLVGGDRVELIVTTVLLVVFILAMAGLLLWLGARVS